MDSIRYATDMYKSEAISHATPQDIFIITTQSVGKGIYDRVFGGTHVFWNTVDMNAMQMTSESFSETVYC